MRHKILLPIMISILLGFNLACQKQTIEWQGTVDKINGLTVVKNPDKPLYGEFMLDLEEDLSIGNEEDENYLFYRVRGISLDSEDNIYVVDSGNYRIQKFDSSGKYQKTIGRKGEGPGEFRMPLGICFDSKDNIYVRESRKMHIFNKLGEFKGSFHFDLYLADFAVDYEGNILGYADINPRDPATRAIIKMDSQGKTIKKIAEFTDRGIQIIITESATFTLSPNHAYSPRLQFAPLGQDRYVYAYSADYLIDLIDNKGDPTLRIIKEEFPQSINQKEKRYIIERICESLESRNIPIPRKKVEDTLYFSSDRAYFNKILTDDKQRIYVQKMTSVLDESGRMEFDIFNREGYYIYETSLSFSPEIIKNGRIYDIQTSEETGEAKVRRYRIKNWDQLREGF
jgi:hypothetical protein